MDFGALPPEINSGRMYMGAGSGPMLAAAAAWDALAAELHSNAASYESTIQGVTVGSWQGPAAASMTTAAAPFVAWMSTTATQAEQAAAQAKAAAVAYETAFAATVPPPVIEANRALLMTLIATNIFGQNTPAIAATEAQYLEMWAQDAAAMYAYAGSSAAATELTPFTEPPQTTDPSGVARQSAAVAEAVSAAETQSQLAQLLSVIPNALQSVGPAAAVPTAAATPAGSIIEAVYPITAALRPFFAAVTGAYSPIGAIILPGGWWLLSLQLLGLAQNGPGVAELLGGGKAIAGGLAPLRGGYVSSVAPTPGGVTGSMGGSTLVGSLSVPQGWVTEAPVMRTLASVLPGTSAAAAPSIPVGPPGTLFGEMAMASLAGRALAGASVRTVSSTGTGTTAGAVADDVASTATIIVIPAD